MGGFCVLTETCDILAHACGPLQFHALWKVMIPEMKA